jgi:hypothetical protein
MRSGDKCKGSLDVRFGGYSTGATSLHRKTIEMSAYTLELDELSDVFLYWPIHWSSVPSQDLA